MNNIQALKIKYADKIMFEPKTPSELIDWLKSELSAQHLPLETFTDAFIESLRFNAAHAYTSRQSSGPQDYNFAAYKLPCNEKSKKYYCDDLWKNKEPYVFAVIETSTGYIYSNHPRLLFELTIEKGISKDDFDTDSLVFANYVVFLDLLYSNSH